MLTIGELASHAGVTVRTVRHYHAKGLLPEPERDHSGYRRYDAGAVVELIKIRTLAEAGVPLRLVRELLQADEAEFAAAITDIDKRLRAEIRERQRHRERIARLAPGDHLALPPEVVEYLDRLRALGADERIVQVERDGWIPLAALSPERIPEWMARKRRQITDPQFVGFYLTLSQALDRAHGDPLLVELADELASYIAQMADEQGEEYVDDTDIEPSFAKLMDTLAFDTLPLARQLIELLTKRGWTGWTKLERVGPVRGAAGTGQEDAAAQHSRRGPRRSHRQAGPRPGQPPDQRRAVARGRPEALDRRRRRLRRPTPGVPPARPSHGSTGPVAFGPGRATPGSAAVARYQRLAATQARRRVRLQGPRHLGRHHDHHDHALRDRRREGMGHTPPAPDAPMRVAGARGRTAHQRQHRHPPAGRSPAQRRRTPSRFRCGGPLPVPLWPTSTWLGRRSCAGSILSAPSE